jgi:hypothetical protein
MIFFDIPDADLAANQLEAVRTMLDAAAVVDALHDRTHALWCLAAALAIAARESGLTQEETELCFIATADQIGEIYGKLGPDPKLSDVITEEHVR